MKLQDIQAVYFIGAGGIGMSALVRYFHHKGLVVAGYDKTPTDLTRCLEKEGIQLHYEDNINLIPDVCKNPSTTLVVYTPAIPNTHSELIYFRENHFEIEKRAQVLGRLTQTHKGLCFAGTHGKTSTSTMCFLVVSLKIMVQTTYSRLKAIMLLLKPMNSTVLSIGYVLI